MQQRALSEKLGGEGLFCYILPKRKVAKCLLILKHFQKKKSSKHFSPSFKPIPSYKLGESSLSCLKSEEKCVQHLRQRRSIVPGPECIWEESKRRNHAVALGFLGSGKQAHIAPSSPCAFLCPFTLKSTYSVQEPCWMLGGLSTVQSLRL